MESSFNQTGSGTAGYLGLYFGGMIFSSLYDLISKKNSLNYHSIGASGAVSAILFSYILFNPWGILLMFAIIPVPAIVFGVLYLVYCQYMSKRSKDNINHNAHFYGAIYGFVFPVILHPASMQIFIDKLMNFDLF
jgi:membrane associated rhomboid family serine protease